MGCWSLMKGHLWWHTDFQSRSVWCLIQHGWTIHPRLCGLAGYVLPPGCMPSTTPILPGSKTAAIDVSFTFADCAVSRSMSTTNATAAASRCLTDMLFVISIYKVLRTIFGIRMQDKHSSSAVAALLLYCKSRLLAAI